MQFHLFKSRLDPELIPIQSPKVLLGCHDKTVGKIRNLVGIQPEIYTRLYEAPLLNLAALVQSCPASESHHHAYPGGLLQHILEACVHALSLRQGQILPAGASPESASKVSDLYTYAVFAGSILHDIAKPLTDQRIGLYGRNGRSLDAWNPFMGWMSDYKKAKYFKVSFDKERSYQSHHQSALLFATSVLTAEGLFWLRSEPEVYASFLDLFSDPPSGSLYHLVSSGDQRSVASSLGSQTVSRFATSRPLWMKMKASFRTLIDNGEISLNRAGATGWVDQRGIWLVSKRVTDLLREQLTKEGHEGVPHDNTRIFDVLSEHGLIALTSGGRAIWRCKISTEDWQPENVFSVLLMPLSQVWNDPDDAPMFEGEITVIEANDEATSVDSRDGEHPEKAPVSKVTEANSDTESQPEIKGAMPVKAATVETNYHDFFSVETTPSKEEELQVDPDSPEPTNATYTHDDPDLGVRFHRWLQDGINRKRLLVNTAKSVVHFVDIGVLIVSPLAFKRFANDYSLEWEKVQSEFQKLRINLKTDEDANWFKVRTEGKRKAGGITGWIIPFEHMSLDIAPISNEHLTVLTPVSTD